MSNDISRFTSAIRASFRGLWRGEFTTIMFAEDMFTVIKRGFELAWREGAEEAGIMPNERTQEEQDKLDLMVGQNFQYVGTLAQWIFANRKDAGGAWATVEGRTGVWISRYDEVKNLARLMSGENIKQVWRIGNTEKSCRTCLKLAGRVHRKSVWLAHNIAPQMITDLLECGGWRCDCRLEDTDEPMTRGRFPNLP